MPTFTTPRRHPCGCVVGYTVGGTRMGFREECPDARKIFSSMMADKRGQTREVSAEWKAKFDEHLGGLNSV